MNDTQRETERKAERDIAPEASRESTSLNQRVQQLIETLKLTPHPEGGWYRETYRASPEKPESRPASTCIYFLLSSETRSKFHRIDADEGWHHYEGDTVRVHLLSGREHTHLDVGSLSASAEPQAMVPAGLWFGAEVLPGPHGYALVGCTVAPAFDFNRFELADPDQLIKSMPEHRELIERISSNSSSV